MSMGRLTLILSLVSLGLLSLPVAAQDVTVTRPEELERIPENPGAFEAGKLSRENGLPAIWPKPPDPRPANWLPTLIDVSSVKEQSGMECLACSLLEQHEYNYSLRGLYKSFSVSALFDSMPQEPGGVRLSNGIKILRTQGAWPVSEAVPTPLKCVQVWHVNNQNMPSSQPPSTISTNPQIFDYSKDPRILLLKEVIAKKGYVVTFLFIDSGDEKDQMILENTSRRPLQRYDFYWRDEIKVTSHSAPLMKRVKTWYEIQLETGFSGRGPNYFSGMIGQSENRRSEPAPSEPSHFVTLCGYDDEKHLVHEFPSKGLVHEIGAFTFKNSGAKDYGPYRDGFNQVSYGGILECLQPNGEWCVFISE